MVPGAIPPTSIEQFQAKQDQDQLALLRILWKVYSGLACIGVCAGFFYIFLGNGMAGNFSSTPSSAASDTRMLTTMFTIFGLAISFVAGTASVLSWIVSEKLIARKTYGLCFALACLICLNMPMGTALGIFTIVVLNRVSVKRSFS